MLVTKITPKTIKIEAEPGDRINVDSDGYAIQEATYRFGGNSSLHDDILSATKTRNTLKRVDEDDRDDLWCAKMSNANTTRYSLISQVLELPVYRSRRVFVGFNY